MTVHKLTAGSGYTYLTKQVAAHDATQKPTGDLGAYYSNKGENPGQWMGRGLAGLAGVEAGSAVTEAQMLALFGQGRQPNSAQIETAARNKGLEPDEVDLAGRLGKPYQVFEASSDFQSRCATAFREFNTDLELPSRTPVPDENRARIRTDITREMFNETFGRPPLDARELSGHLARISRQTTTAVAGYDLTFSPVKSVSTLWAIAPRDAAAVIERSHADAVADTIDWLERHATYSRTGHAGVAQVEVRGLIAASFTHRDSRAGDPDLHTHVAISNKVQLRDDDRWLALDGRGIYKNGVAASERYNTRIEALLSARLGVRFADRVGTEAGKRAVREVVGVDGPLPRLWSSRRAAIDGRRATLATAFQRDHGRTPTAREAIQLAQQANLETRGAKHELRSHAQQRATWRAEAVGALGGESALEAYVNGALRDSKSPMLSATPAWVAQTARVVLSVVQGHRATWQESHIRAEAERQIRTSGIRLTDVDGACEAIVGAALSPQLSVRLGGRVTPHDVPPPLRRSDGSCVFDVAGSATFTSSDVLAAEGAVLLAADYRDGRVIAPGVVDSAIAASASEGVVLNPGQVDLVRELATSGARVQLALAPAGTGKTTALRALADAWSSAGGTVVGLAPSAAASAVLREQIGTTTDTLAKLVHAVATGLDVSDWVRSIGPGSLVLLDEAAMAGTLDLARMVEFVTGVGGSVRLIGDDQQLGSVGAGGLLRDLAHSCGAVRLTEVVRFVDPDTGAPDRAEGAASLALRDGNPSALAHYVDRGRLHVGDRSAVIEDAFAAWSADRTAGRDAILLAPTRELVADLNERARAERLAKDGMPTREVPLAGSSRVSAGDIVITRRNARTLLVGFSDWVKNGDRWNVTDVRQTGELDVVHRRTGKHVTLPARYVHAHVTLGYASTVHGAQGITADRCYAIATGAETRQLVYVALTRGRHANHLFLATVGDGDPHDAITRDALLPPTAVDVLSRILERQDAPMSATSAARAQNDPVLRLASAAAQFQHTLATAAQEHLGTRALTDIDAAAELVAPGLTGEASYPTLRTHLALRAISGGDPVSLLRQAAADPRGLDDARDPAAILDWRLDPTGPGSGCGPLPWLPDVPARLRTDDEWGPYLLAQAAEVDALASRVMTDALAWSTADFPPWAHPLAPEDRELVGDLAVWRAAQSTAEGDLRPSGPVLPGAADARHQLALDERVARVLGRPETATAYWAPLARRLDGRLLGDPWWPVLAERLTAAHRVGHDVPALAREVCARALPDELPAAALWWRLSGRVPSTEPSTAAEPTGTPFTIDAVDPGTTTDTQRATSSALEATEAHTLRLLSAKKAQILDLNGRAAGYFAAAFPISWAADYLADRLGKNALDDVRSCVGFAPAGWTGLTDHLRALGFVDDDIVSAGLGARASTGRVIDRFRDRVVFAIHGVDGIHGWIGRRNPAADGVDDRSPKYLNTSDTVLFTKGAELFGLMENDGALARGADPVLVEGPIDALAVTLAGRGDFVGIAPMGTAFTEAQADRLLRSLPPGRPGVVVGTDDDAAGRAAAERVFWRLTSHGQDPRQLALPAGGDPAEMLERQGPGALKDRLDGSGSLATAIIDDRIDAYADRLDTVEGQVHATRRAAEVIAALPVGSWPEHLTHVVARTSLAPEIVLMEVLDRSSAHGPGAGHPTPAARTLGAAGEWHVSERAPSGHPSGLRPAAHRARTGRTPRSATALAP